MKGRHANLIPRFNRNSAILGTLLVTELFAIVVTLIIADTNMLTTFGMVSIYCQWVSLLSISGLSLLRFFVSRVRSKGVVLVLMSLICISAFTLTEVIAQEYLLKSALNGFDWKRYFSLLGVAVIMMFAVFRWFKILEVVAERNRSETEMKLRVLQSRIRPHFLFNCLNSIAELVHVDPDMAEEAVGSLGHLFRASLENIDKEHSLESEMKLCSRYLSLEKLRLGELLQVKQKASVSNQSKWMIPKLIIQPLIENAIQHGRLEDGRVELELDLRETNRFISILVKNAVNPGAVNKAGNGIALNNIRETLYVMYDDQQSFKVRSDDAFFQVILRFPKKKSLTS